MTNYEDFFQFTPRPTWVVEMPGASRLHDAPLIVNDEIVVRFGDSVGGFALADGAATWRQKIAEKAGHAVRLLAHRDLFISDYRRPPAREVSLAALRTGGPVVWAIDTGGVILHESVSLCGDDLLVISGGKSEGKTLRIIDTADGRVRTNVPLWQGATTALSLGDSIFVSSSEEGSGLIQIGPGGQEVLAPAAVHAMVGSHDSFATVTERGELQLRDSTGKLRWSAPASGELAIDADDVLCFDGEPSSPRPVLRSLGDGAEKWRGQALPSQPLGACLVGPLAVARFSRGIRLLDRANGSLVAGGEGHFSDGIALLDRHVVLGCSTFLLRAELP
jgi:hypothetical protein